MREVLSDETVQVALLTLRDKNVPVDAKDEAEAIVSVRKHSRASGYAECLADLLSLADMIPAPLQEEDTTYQPDQQ